MNILPPNFSETPWPERWRWKCWAAGASLPGLRPSKRKGRHQSVHYKDITEDVRKASKHIKTMRAINQWTCFLHIYPVLVRVFKSALPELANPVNTSFILLWSSYVILCHWHAMPLDLLAKTKRNGLFAVSAKKLLTHPAHHSKGHLPLLLLSEIANLQRPLLAGHLGRFHSGRTY